MITRLPDRPFDPAVLNWRLEALGEDCNAAVDALNSGGCAVYAAIVAERLTEAGIPAWGHVSMQWLDRVDGRKGGPYDLDAIHARFGLLRARDWLDYTDVRFNHVLVGYEAGGRRWIADSNGTDVYRDGMHEWTCDGLVLRGRLELQELQALAKEPSIWNDWFHRRSGMPKIRRRARKHLTPDNLRV